MMTESGTNLTQRTPDVVGRRTELQLLNELLLSPKDEHYVYIWGDGGLGKTRLLEALQKMVKDAGLDFVTSGIIDLYHTDTHSTSDVERLIVEGLDSNARHFGHYRDARYLFERMRERGAFPAQLEERRAELSKLFVDDCVRLAAHVRKIVICFDTVELLQYESSIIEEKAGLASTDTLLKTWLLQNLPKLKNILVVFAGRPRQGSLGETGDPQSRFLSDLRTAFGDQLVERQLQPLNPEESRELVHELNPAQPPLSDEQLATLHCLTDGRPILLHLFVDRVTALANSSSEVFDLLDNYRDLVPTPVEDKRLAKAKEALEVTLIKGFLQHPDLGGYLAQLAMMPKGFDVEILQAVFGVPEQEAHKLTEQLRELSFIKRYGRPREIEQERLAGTPAGYEAASSKQSGSTDDTALLYPDRYFYHDEMYRIWNNRSLFPALRVAQRQAAYAVMTRYYEPRIQELKQQILKLDADDRVRPRERQQKLEVEWLYYALISNPRRGYEEYLRLSDDANRQRWVGFGMRLLNEFLRFCSSPTGLGTSEEGKVHTGLHLLLQDGIMPDRVLRDSISLWVERYWWWGQYQHTIDLAGQVLNDPGGLFVRPAQDLALLCNICARWTNANALLYQYQPYVVERALAEYRKLAAIESKQPEHLLALARLCTTIGYQYRIGGRLGLATRYYDEARAAFMALEDRSDEYVMLLNNSAFAHARQGRMALARTFAHEALSLHQGINNEFIRGLTYSTLSNIARMRGNYAQAKEYGDVALAIFQKIEDGHGMAVAYLSLAQADRRMAKHAVEKGYGAAEAIRRFEVAERSAKSALEIAQANKLEADRADAQAELGRIARDMGQAVNSLRGSAEGEPWFKNAERLLLQALENKGSESIDAGDLLQDLAEVYFDLGQRNAADDLYKKLCDIVPSGFVLQLPYDAQQTQVQSELYLPLGKMEMLQGQMDFADKRAVEGLQHYVYAYVYFSRFSDEALEIDTMIEYLHKHLRAFSLARQQEIFREVIHWLKQNRLTQVCRPFTRNLADLVGMNLDDN
jgi:tetratricopeptide (TPR) repeat protein